MADLALAYDADESEDGALSDASDEQSAVISLEKIAETGLNLAEHLDEQESSAVVRRCTEGYERDKASREDWVTGFDRGMELVRLTSRTTSALPFDNAADVRFPLIATACIQFNARAYPAIVNGPQIVRAEIEGDDPGGQKAGIGEKLADHMSWQLLTDMPEWEPDTDKLLLHLPAAGMAFRQYSWDKPNGRPKSEFISAKRFVINQEASDLATAPLYTVEFERYPYQIVEAQRAGRWRDITLGLEDADRQKHEHMLRCHVRYDLDQDGYDEPYIAVIHKYSQALLSLTGDFWPQDIHREGGKVLKVDRRCLIVPYGFIPDPEGKFYSLGFGQLLLNHNQVVDALLNQMLDATTLNNMGGGFIGAGAKLPGGVIDRQPGQWKSINTSGQTLQQSLVPYPQVPVSPTSFQLLENIIQSGKELTSTTAAITGNAPGNQPATTTLSNVEQSSQIITAINKRVFRSIGAECEVLQALNGAYLPEQGSYGKGGKAKPIARSDYLQDEIGIKPVADPSMASAPQRMAQVQFLQEVSKDNPLFDPQKVNDRIMMLARIPNYQELLKPPPPPGPSPQEQMQLEAAATELAAKHADVLKTQADIRAVNAKAAGDLAEADSATLDNEAKARLLHSEDTGAAAGALDANNLTTFEQLLEHPVPSGVGGVAPAPNDPAGQPGADPSGGGAAPAMGAGGMGQAGDPGGNAGVPADGGDVPGDSGTVAGPTSQN